MLRSLGDESDGFCIKNKILIEFDLFFKYGPCGSYVELLMGHRSRAVQSSSSYVEHALRGILLGRSLPLLMPHILGHPHDMWRRAVCGTCRFPATFELVHFLPVGK